MIQPDRLLEETWVWTTVKYGLYYADDYNNALHIYNQLCSPLNDYRMKTNRDKNYEWYFNYYGSNNFAIVYPEKHTYVLDSPNIYGDIYVYSIPTFNYSSTRTFNIRVNTPNVRMFVKIGWMYWDPYNIQLNSCERYKLWRTPQDVLDENVSFMFCSKEPLTKVEIEFTGFMPSARLGKFTRDSDATITTKRPGSKYYTSNELHEVVFPNLDFDVITKTPLPNDIHYLF